MKPENPKYEEFRKHLSKIADLNAANSVLGWDQQVYMPKNGAQFRGRQLATLSSMAHELFVSEAFGNLIEELSGDGSLPDAAVTNVRLVRRDLARKRRYPQAFVEEMALTASNAFGAWHEAKTKRDFSIFRPLLEKIVRLKREETEFLGYEDHPYDALVEDYEPGLTVRTMDRVFDGLKERFFPYMRSVAAKAAPPAPFLSRNYPRAEQWAFSKGIIEKMGYDFDSGRADDAPHPFCTTFAPGDVRITVRGDENEFTMMFFAAVHEAGHALYELGIPMKDEYGLPLGSAVSLAFHESQSRFWENNIARSLSFWKGHYAGLQAMFPANLGPVPLEDFYRGINRIAPSFVRVEADELTYHAHILIRYLVEKALITKEIEVKDLPAFWNEKYREYLGITPAHDAEGCLQDVHWAYGAFGYFPTYSFGSFYAAQLGAAMKAQIPDFDSKVERGEFAPILSWLNENIHAHGRRYSSEELLRRTTGGGLDVGHFIDYARDKYDAMK